MVSTLKGKVALVTGASTGIGRSSASIFARNGAKVVVADVNIEGAQETVDIIKNFGGEAIFIKTDVSKAQEVAALINKTIEKFGRLDCAHNNAGILFHGPESNTANCTEEEWDRLTSINYKGVWLCMKYEIIQMLKQGSGGAIVNTSSIAGLVGLKDSIAYNAAKHGVMGLTRAAALEYARDGIRINAVCPAFIKTPMLSPTGEDFGYLDDLVENNIPLGRLGEPDEVGEAAVWLCSDAASFITGHGLPVDGGWVAR
jgi:NAD(P)-dependent dehydrogenase (short-subunit alcohol dehydrogenase family)